MPGVSETIRVTSIVGRFLEHSRVFYFSNGGNEEIYLGSADLMERNLDRRVEVLFPILDPIIAQTMRDEILGTYQADNAKARYLRPDGTYAWLSAGDAPVVDSQQRLLDNRTSSVI